MPTFAEEFETSKPVWLGACRYGWNNQGLIKVTGVYGRHRHSVVDAAQSRTLAWSAPVEPCEAAPVGMDG